MYKRILLSEALILYKTFRHNTSMNGNLKDLLINVNMKIKQCNKLLISENCVKEMIIRFSFLLNFAYIDSIVVLNAYCIVSISVDSFTLWFTK